VVNELVQAAYRHILRVGFVAGLGRIARQYAARASADRKPRFRLQRPLERATPPRNRSGSDDLCGSDVSLPQYSAVQELLAEVYEIPRPSRPFWLDRRSRENR
jgi:hypothetical protein